jgi:hypothetical protein
MRGHRRMPDLSGGYVNQYKDVKAAMITKPIRVDIFA